MRKWLYSSFCALVFLTAVVLLLPILMGFLAENRSKQIVNIINDTSPIHLEITNYQRSWFHSNATAVLTLDKLDPQYQELHQLNITAHIKHGPLLIDWARFNFAQAIVDADINLNPAQNHFLKRDFDADPIASIRIKFRLSGDADIKINSSPLVYQGQKGNFNWQGLKINMKFSPLYNKLQSKIDFSGIDVGLTNYKFHIGKATSFYQGNKITDGLWAGERNLQITSFAIKNGNGKITSLGGLNLHFNITEAENKSVDLATTLSIDKMNINGASYSKSELDLAVDRLKQEALIKLQEQFISGKNIFFTQASIGLDTIATLINNGSAINIKQLKSNTPWGKVIANFKVVFNGQPSGFGMIAALFNSTINADFKAQRHLVLHLIEKFYQAIPSSNIQLKNSSKKAEELLNSWLQSGKITTADKDNYLHMTLDYKDKQLLISDKELIFTTKP